MNICYALTEEPGPAGQDVWVVQQPERMFVLAHRPVADDPDQLLRRISLVVTEHVEREWMHVGVVAAS